MLSPENPIFEGFLLLWLLRNFYIPILLLKDEYLKKSLEFYLDFENSSSLTNFGFSDPPYRGVTKLFFQKNHYNVVSDRYAHLLRGSTNKIIVKDPPYSYAFGPKTEGSGLKYVVTYYKHHYQKNLKKKFGNPPVRGVWKSKIC